MFDRIHLWSYLALGFWFCFVFLFWRFLITVLISALVIGLFIISISSWLSLGKLNYSKNLPISSSLFILLVYQSSSVQSLSCVRIIVTPWIGAHQASLSITNSRSLPKPMSIESMMQSSHLVLCRSLLLLIPIPPSIRVFSNESTLRIKWPKY